MNALENSLGRRFVEPAIDLAEDGFDLSPWDVNKYNERAFAIGLASKASPSSVFFKDDGESYSHGERLKQPDLAWSLKKIRKGGADCVPTAGLLPNGLPKKLVPEKRRAQSHIDVGHITARLNRDPLSSEFIVIPRLVTMPPASRRRRE